MVPQQVCLSAGTSSTILLEADEAQRVCTLAQRHTASARLGPRAPDALETPSQGGL